MKKTWRVAKDQEQKPREDKQINVKITGLEQTGTSTLKHMKMVWENVVKNLAEIEEDIKQAEVALR